jgi:cell division protein FtsL
MSLTPLEAIPALSRPVNNSRLVREVDPHASRELWTLVLLVGVLAAGLGVYAWPHLASRQTGAATTELLREKESLIEENRKLRLEKEALENLDRIEVIATRDLGLSEPDPSRVIVVELPRPSSGVQMASRQAPYEARP